MALLELPLTADPPLPPSPKSGAANAPLRATARTVKEAIEVRMARWVVWKAVEEKMSLDVLEEDAKC